MFACSVLIRLSHLCLNGQAYKILPSNASITSTLSPPTSILLPFKRLHLFVLELSGQRYVFYSITTV